MLHSSQAGGTRNLEQEGNKFGWNVIVNMFGREMERRKANKIERIPGLRESYIIRDSWTKLNVYPSKIMQARF